MPETVESRWPARLVRRAGRAAALCTALALAGAPGFADGFSRRGARPEGCANQRVIPMAASVHSSGEQSCPSVRIGPGIPFVGQLEIFSLGTRSCPVVQTRVPPHNTPVPWPGFDLVRGDSSPIQIRDVECHSGTNLLVIGTSSCSYGPWQNTPSVVYDYSAVRCEDS
jgi:hypothetical protein